MRRLTAGVSPRKKRLVNSRKRRYVPAWAPAPGACFPYPVIIRKGKGGHNPPKLVGGRGATASWMLVNTIFDHKLSVTKRDK
jgi:hypothetical protein